MTKSAKYFLSFVASLGLVSLMALPAFAQQRPLSPDDLGVGAIGGEIKLGGGDVRTTAARIINVALGFLGIVSVVIVLMGGFKYMLSGGSTEKTDEARKLIVSGIIGLAIILSAWAITTFVVTRLISATQDT